MDSCPEAAELLVTPLDRALQLGRQAIIETIHSHIAHGTQLVVLAAMD